MAGRSKVVDFQRFRESRDRDRLPLFDGIPLSADPAPARRLNSREVAHREQMLSHLKERAIALARS